jgi:lipopolysaccharide export system protein LptA
MKYKGFVIILFILLVGLGRAYSAGIELISAGRMQAGLSGEGVLRLSGGVKLREGTRLLTSQNALWDRTRDFVNFDGYVVLIDTGFTLTSNRLSYSRPEGYARATHEAMFVRNDSLVMASGEVGEFFTGESLLVLTGAAVLDYRDTVEMSLLRLSAQKIRYYTKKRTGAASGVVRLTVSGYGEDKEGKDSVDIYGDSLHYDMERDMLKVFKKGGNRSSLLSKAGTAQCDSAVYRRSDNFVELYGSPEVKTEDGILSGGLMVLYLTDGSADSLVVSEGTKGRFNNEGKDGDNSTFESAGMVIVFNGKKIDHAILGGKVTMNYLRQVTSTKPDEALLIKSDSAFVNFVDGTADSVFSWGYVAGQYTRVRGQDAIYDTLYFNGEEGHFDILDNRAAIKGNTDARYKDTSIRAYMLVYDVEGETITASSSKEADTLTGKPELTMGGTSLRGDMMSYNLKTERGKVISGWSKVEPGYFQGRSLIKGGKDTLYAVDAYFTTCDCENDTADYWFYSPKIKLIPKDKAIAEKIVLYIGELPVFYLPFFVFPSNQRKKKRYSFF